MGGTVALLLWWLAPALPPPSHHPFGLGLREAAPAATGFGLALLAWQSAAFTALRGALSAAREGGGWAYLLLLGFGYGAFHAAGPGHGKAIIASYLVASERALRRGVAVTLAAALTQAAVAIGLVFVVFALVGATAATMGRTASAVELAGFFVVVAFGAVLLWRKAGRLDALLRNETSAHPDDCACGPIDPATSRGGVRQMAAVALGAGIRPCAGAIVLLTLSRSYGLFGLGIAAVLAMALGTALTTGALAALAVFAKRAALRLASGRRSGAALAGAGAELAAAALVFVVGVALLLGYWDGSGPT